MEAYKRLVIVDPQLKDQKGHNFRYASGIAGQLGLPTTVLAHQDFDTDDVDGMTAHPLLSFDQYNNSAFKDSFREPLFDRLGRYKTRLFSRLRSPNALWPEKSPLALTIRFLLFLADVLLFIPALIRQLYLLIRGRGSSAHRDATALELQAAFDFIDLNEHDLLIFQTMMWPTFESLLELRVQADRHYGCDALFLVHEDWRIYGLGHVRFTPAHLQQRVLESLPFRRSKVLSTNEPLSDYVQQWGGYRPDTFREIDYPVERLPERRSPVADRKRLLIPGVYRGDKNFESLPTLLSHIAREHDNLDICLHQSVATRVPLVVEGGNKLSFYEDVPGADEWLTFLCSFDVILIPYGDIYAHRISGIIHEARLLSIPVTCSRAIADASLIRHPEALFEADGEGVGQALSFCLSRSGTDFYVPGHPPTIAQQVERSSGWIDYRDKPVAVQIKPAWTRCGTTAVLDAQLDYLVSRGYFVVEIYLKHEPWQKQPEQVDFMWKVMRGGRDNTGGMVLRILLKNFRLPKFAAYAIRLLRGRIAAFFERENIHGTWCTPDTELQYFLRNHKPQLALVNHIFNAGFAFEHVPADIYICETHDIQINQLLMRRPELRASYDIELQYEMDLLGRFDAVVNLNRGEHAQIAGHIGERAHFIRPPIVHRPTIRRYPTLAALVKAEAQYEAVDKLPAQFDLLIIGDGHPANIESTEHFLTEVFSKLPAGTTLGMVGTVCHHLYEHPVLETSKHIHLLGFVDDLANLQDFVRLQVLPDIAGEGIPIKTDEAIARGMPFVATAHALRGFTEAELAQAGVRGCRDSDDMLTAIRAALTDEEARHQLLNGMQQLAANNNNEAYQQAWDRMLAKQQVNEE